MSASSENLPEAAVTSAGAAKADSENLGDMPILPGREDLGPDEEDLDLDPAAVSETGVTPDVENLRD